MTVELTGFFPVPERADAALDKLNDAGFDISSASLVAGEDAKTVAGFLGFAPVGVEDAEAEISFFRRNDREDAIAAQPPMTVADGFNGGRRKLEAQFFRVHDQIIIAQAMAPEKPVSHAALLERSWTEN